MTETFTRVDPAELTRETGTYEATSPEGVRAAFAAAAAAAREWGRSTGPEREAILRRAADLLEARLDEAAERLVADIGKPIRDARAETLRAAAILRFHGAEALQPDGETHPSSEPDTRDDRPRGRASKAVHDIWRGSRVAKGSRL